MPLARTTPFSYPRATVAAVGRVLAALAREEAQRGRRDRPFVTLSWAQSLDGCLAIEPGQPTALSGDESLALTHALRAAHDVIMIGVGTLLADDPALTVRFWPGASPAPLVLDSRLRTSLQSRLVAGAGTRAVAFACTQAGAVDQQQRLEACGARVLRLPACASGWVDLPALLAKLGETGCKRVMVEGGAKVLTSFLQAGLADFAIVTVAPRFLGGLSAVGRLQRGSRPQIATPVHERFGTDLVMAGRAGAAPRARRGRGEAPRAGLHRAVDAVELVEEACPVPGPGEVLVQTRISAVSAGTELLAFRGQLPADLPLDETLPGLKEASFRYPFRYGYAQLGVVTGLGAGVDAALAGRRVFAFAPHASAFVAPVTEIFAVPDDVPDQLAPLLASAETAVNLVFDGRPLLGERVAVVGQGVVGLLVTALLARFPLETLLAVEPQPGAGGAGAALGGAAGARADSPKRGPQLGARGADLSYELSGNPVALDARHRADRARRPGGGRLVLWAETGAAGSGRAFSPRAFDLAEQPGQSHRPRVGRPLGSPAPHGDRLAAAGVDCRWPI